MYRLMRPLLFAMDAERSHRLGLRALAAYGALPGPVRPAPGPVQTLMGLRFHNPIGLAAGLDKDALAVLGLARLGFGHIEVGAVTPRPQPGNPKPRLFRLPAANALINRMGFNNAGAAALAARLNKLKGAGGLAHTPIGVNIGKNRTTPISQAVDDYLACMEVLYASADYLTINLSSPNTPDLRELQYGQRLRDLLHALKERQANLQAKHGRYVPLCLKLAPDLEDEDLGAIAEAVRTFAVDGLVAVNTTVRRPLTPELRHAGEVGGLSGAPLAPLARNLVAQLRGLLGPDRPIIGVGGIMSVADARAMFDAGADLVQIYTGLIYQGPSLVRSIAAQGLN